MKFILLIFILLSSVGFYDPNGIFPAQTQKMLFYFFCICGLVYSFFNGRSTDKISFPRVAYIIILIGIVFSALMASAFHDQGIKTSIIAIMPYFFGYLCFYIFLRLNIKRDQIINTFIVLTFISSFVYFVNLATAPFVIFGKPIDNIDLSRGIVRITIVFIELFPLMLFYSINQWFETHKHKWLFYAGFLVIMIFLSVTRQIIFTSLIFGLWYLLRNINWQKKLAVLLAAVIVVVYVLPMIPIYNTMVELSQEQKDENERNDNIRIVAWEFYTVDAQTNEITPFLGNGVASMGNSPWGNEFEQETDSNKCFDVDVGWAGFFFHFGLISTLALLWIFYSAISKKKAEDNQFTTYWLVLIAVTAVVSGPILFYFQIVVLSLVLYLVYNPSAFSSKEKTEQVIITNNPNFSISGYPQLHSPQ